MKLRCFSNSGFDRGAPVWREALWVICRAFLFLSPFPWPSSLKVQALRWFGAKIGRRVVIRAQVNISFPWRLTIEDDVWIGDGVWILSLGEVTLESDVCISQRSYLCTGSHDYRKESFDLLVRPIVVREGSWIAANAFLGPGVNFGPHSVAGAGSVICRSVAAYTLVAGNPAVPVKDLAASVG